VIAISAQKVAKCDRIRAQPVINGRRVPADRAHDRRLGANCGQI
jgi:hypothetical protein